ncbi:MAG: class I SAM-dependent methyltransferase [Rhodocyclaceae bacterium]|nr:class I SAM-dependent methyltransferase [Rhodocyclaceae bacterium]MBX3669655.1 class I SAM-dependent methyltransferase [Rhodocyclaceae bacterium]
MSSAGRQQTTNPVELGLLAQIPPARWPAWFGAPLRLLARRLLAGTSFGAIELKLPDGSHVTAQGAQPGPAAVVVVQRWRALARLALGGDRGFADAYLDGDWNTPELAALLEFGALNEAGWRGKLDACRPLKVLARIEHARRANTRSGSRRNIAFHYDLGNDFYRHWLDAELIYSSGIYSQLATTLEQAQAAKIARVIELMQLDAAPQAASVLEIGCGWGALACALARRHGVHVTGLSLSTQQLEHARARAAREGLQQLTDLRLQDYRDAGGCYDRIVSIEMMEAVGEHYWPDYFKALRARLADGGRAVIQAITIDEAHFEHYRANPDFIQRHIFPGGMLPTTAALRREAERAGLQLVHTETFGASYAATLAEWRHRFVTAWPAIAALGYDLRFRRMWEYYLCYCEAGFRTQRVDVGLYTFVPARRGGKAERLRNPV